MYNNNYDLMMTITITMIMMTIMIITLQSVFHFLKIFTTSLCDYDLTSEEISTLWVAVSSVQL